MKLILNPLLTLYVLQYLCENNISFIQYLLMIIYWILNVIVKGFGSRERAFSMGVNAYSDPRRKNRPHATLIYGPRQSKFEIDYYI